MEKQKQRRRKDMEKMTDKEFEDVRKDARDVLKKANELLEGKDERSKQFKKEFIEKFGEESAREYIIDKTEEEIEDYELEEKARKENGKMAEIIDKVKSKLGKSKTTNEDETTTTYADTVKLVDEEFEELVHLQIERCKAEGAEFEDFKCMEAIFRIRNEKYRVETDAYLKEQDNDAKAKTYKNRLSIDNIVSCVTVLVGILGSIMIENKLGIIVPRQGSALTNKLKFKS